MPLNGRLAYLNEQSPVSSDAGDTNDLQTQRANGDRSPITLEELQAAVQGLTAEVAALHEQLASPPAAVDQGMPDELGLSLDDESMPAEAMAPPAEETQESAMPPAPGAPTAPGGPIDPAAIAALLRGARG